MYSVHSSHSKGNGGLQKEVPVIEAEVVQSVRLLAQRGWGSRRIAAELGIARETARRYAKMPTVAVGTQRRPKGRRLSADETSRVLEVWTKEAAGNAVLVRRIVGAEGIALSLRTVQRLTSPARADRAKKDRATVRFETPPGAQMQIDFGQKLVSIANVRQKIFFFVAVLGFSRRIFVMASLSERQEDWQEGISAAFSAFGGSTATLLIDNPKAMVFSNVHDGQKRCVVLHPAFVGFCKDWGVVAKACTPSRARTKGKVENGVGYVKHNAIADQEFLSFEALQQHLLQWMHEADRRIHGTTKKRPIDLFHEVERVALTPLPKRPVASRTRRLKRRVASDCLVDVDTVRYSAPHRFVGAYVMVEVGDTQVRLYAGEACIASHPRCQERERSVVDYGHYEGLMRGSSAGRPGAISAAANPDLVDVYDEVDTASETTRSLSVYEQIVQGATS